MLATEVIYEAENGLLPEADVPTASNPANAVAVKSTAGSPLRAQHRIVEGIIPDDVFLD